MRILRGWVKGLLVGGISVSALADEATGGDNPTWPYALGEKYHLWVPDHTPVVRAVFLFPWYGCGKDFGEHEGLRVLAGELGTAVMGCEQRLANDQVGIFNALCQLAGKTGRPELEHAPLLVMGHSNMTPCMLNIAHRHPERVIAWIAFKSAAAEQFCRPGACQVPGMVISGENDHLFFGEQLAAVGKLRLEHDALTHMIVEPDGGHGAELRGYTIMLAFIRAVFAVRLPADADSGKWPITLRRPKVTDGWLGKNLEGKRLKNPATGEWEWENPVTVRRKLAIAPYDRYDGDKTSASWLPTGDYARAWQDYCANSQRGPRRRDFMPAEKVGASNPVPVK